MRRPSAYILIFCSGVLAASAFPASPSAAFGLNIGPFHLGLPFIGFPHRFVHRHRAALGGGSNIYDRASLGTASQGSEPVALYPAAALPGLFDEVFWPNQAPPWPYGYDAIFRNAFAQSSGETDASACQQPDRTAAIVGRIGAEVRPTKAQTQLLQKLGKALGTASGYMARACPKAVPAEPVARLQLMQSQLQTLTLAIDVVRPPLQQFEQSLDVQQKARFAAVRSDRAAAVCAAQPTATDWSVNDIDQSVQPDQNQRDALAELKQTFASTAADLHAHCPNPLPSSPLGRLEAIEGRLDASWRAALSMQVALATFEGGLSDQQRNHLEAMNVAQAP